MIVAVVLAVVMAAVAAGALLLARRRRHENARLRDRLATLEGDLRELSTSSTARIAGLEAERDEAAAASEARIAELEPVWPLLLAGVERQWANAVAAGPSERGVIEGRPAVQLEQAVERVLQRLREEVGVDAVLSGAGPSLPPAKAAVVLLGVVQAVERLAPRVETIDVRLGDPVVVTTRGWTGDDELRGPDEDGADVRIVRT